jgi:hypothetical protein|nr:MAG TPA: hypothetical protein [Caudoviricetes sp.]
MEELNGTGESHDMENHIKETHAMLCDIEKDVHKLLNRGGTDSMGENFDSGMLAGLLSKQGVDPGIVAMLNDRTRDGNWGDGGMMVLLFLILILEYGNNGGLFGGRNVAGDVAGVDRTVVNEANYSRMLDAIGGNREAISQLAQTLNCDCNTVQSALAGVDKQLAVNQGSIINAIQSCCCNIRTEVQSTQNAIQSQMAKCCCDTNLNIERQGCQTRQDIQDVRYLVQSTASAQDNLMQSMFSAQNAYLADQFCQIKSREDQREIQSLRDKLAEQRDSANTLAILNAIANKDAISFQGTAGATAFTGTGSLS